VRPSIAPVLTIDGPGGAGKGTVGQRLAIDCNWHYLDSGALYRIVAWLVEERGFEAADIAGLCAAAARMEVECRPKQDGICEILVDGENISAVIRREKVSERASELAPIGEIRSVLADIQQRARKLPGLVADGRDMGTVVFPDAFLKVYLHADLEIRVQRRHKQLIDKGFDANVSALRQAMEERDQRDQTRSLSPLKAASDALVIDTSEIDVDLVVTRIQSVMNERLQPDQ